MGKQEGPGTVFQLVVKKYREYLVLYRDIGDGSMEGVTPFADFYWRYIYHSKYSENAKFSSSG